jgi:hypothetical protein
MSFQRDAAVGSLYFISLQDLSTCFGCFLHPSSGVLKTACATGTSHRMWQVSSVNSSRNLPTTFYGDQWHVTNTHALI